MKCAVCGKGTADGINLYRQNAKGVTGVWACIKHVKIKPDEETVEICKVITGHE